MPPHRASFLCLWSTTDIDPSPVIDVNPGNNRRITLCHDPEAPWAGAKQPAARRERAPEAA